MVLELSANPECACSGCKFGTKPENGLLGHITSEEDSNTVMTESIIGFYLIHFQF